MSQSHIEEQLTLLQSQMHELLDSHQKLKLENGSLREQQNDLLEERAKLIEKNEQARSRVEAMITRLKTMESTQ